MKRVVSFLLMLGALNNGVYASESNIQPNTEYNDNGKVCFDSVTSLNTDVRNKLYNLLVNYNVGEVDSVEHYGAPIYGKAGVRSVENFIKTAFEPVGRVMYIYGGGWNEADDGAGVEALTIGLTQKWLDFASKQNADYDYSDYDYKVDNSVIHDGLDCSGYVGWTLYNMFNDGKGYVTFADKQGYMLEEMGLGKVTYRSNVKSHGVGDIMTSDGHVFISLGDCDDGSLLLLHSSPPGVQLTGTCTPSGNMDSQAIRLAEKYMSKYYPDWYAKYPDSSRGLSYLSDYDRFEWTALSDDEGYGNMTPEEVLKAVFGE